MNSSSLSYNLILSHRYIVKGGPSTIGINMSTDSDGFNTVNGVTIIGPGKSLFVLTSFKMYLCM